MTYGNYPDLSKVKRILIIKLRHLGDVLLTTPVLSSLKRACPDALIDVYVYQESFSMLEGHPALHQLIGHDRSWKKRFLFSRLYKEFSLLRRIKKEKYDLVINLTEGDRGDIVTKFTKASIRVGFEHDHKGIFKRKKVYTHTVKVCGPPRHTVERNLDAVRRLGIFPSPENRDLQFYVPEDAKKRVQTLLLHKNMQDYVLIHPSSRWRFKCWSAKKMHALVKALILRGEKIVITGGKDDFEKEMVETIAQGLDSSLILNLTGQINLKELGALIEKAKALICVDSLPLHLASALKTPTVVLFGPTSDITWGPWKNPHAKVITQKLSCRPCFMDGCGGSKVSDCLETISMESVLSAYEGLKQQSVAYSTN